MEVVEKAKRAMTFVLLQEAACSIPQGFLLQQRRDVVFSQAVGGHSEIRSIFHYPAVRVGQHHDTAGPQQGQHQLGVVY